MLGAPRLVLQQQTAKWQTAKEKTEVTTTPNKGKLSPVRSPRGGKKFVPPEPPSQIAFFVATSPREQLSGAKEALRATNAAQRFCQSIAEDLSSFENKHGFESKRRRIDELTLELADQGGQNALVPLPEVAQSLPGKLIPLISNNPLTGLLCNIQPHEFYKQYKLISAKQRAKSVFGLGQSAQSGKREPLKMSLTDFEGILKILVPQVSLSPQYLEHMLEPFDIVSIYGTGVRVVNFVDVFSFIARCASNAVLEDNLAFFLMALDPTKRGYLPTPLLCGRLLRSWCENRVVGGALMHWRKLCKAFDIFGEIDAKLLESPAVVTPNELRVIVASSRELTEAFSAELECQLTPGPRFVPNDTADASKKK